jgi:hypothetical protein
VAGNNTVVAWDAGCEQLPLSVAELCGEGDTVCGCAWSSLGIEVLHILALRIPFTRMWTIWTTEDRRSRRADLLTYKL